MQKLSTTVAAFLLLTFFFVSPVAQAQKSIDLRIESGSLTLAGGSPQGILTLENQSESTIIKVRLYDGMGFPVGGFVQAGQTVGVHCLYFDVSSILPISTVIQGQTYNVHFHGPVMIQSIQIRIPRYYAKKSSFTLNIPVTLTANLDGYAGYPPSVPDVRVFIASVNIQGIARVYFRSPALNGVFYVDSALFSFGSTP